MIDRLVLQDVVKSFKIGHEAASGTLSWIVSLLSIKEPRETLHVLDGISLTVRSGEIVGLMGKNGSGKSTLLRIASGIYIQDKGTVTVRGKVVSLINLTAGLQDRLTIRDNTYLYCSLFGIQRKEVDRQFASIIDFAELREFVGTKTYQLSEGMKQRIAFSIAVHCRPDILILDEVFEVGDESFKRKSAERIQQLVRAGACVLLVSHDVNIIRRYCTRVILLKDGRIIEDGPTHTLNTYLSS